MKTHRQDSSPDCIAESTSNAGGAAGAIAKKGATPFGSPELLRQLGERFAAMPAPDASEGPRAPDAAAAAAPDDLMGFHLVTAITQDTVNFQLRQMWKRGVIRKSLDVVLDDTGIELHAELDTPTVNFGMTDQRTVLFSLRMKRGTFVYYTGFGPRATKQSVDFNDWVYTFRVNMNLAEIERQALLNKVEVPDAVKEMVRDFEPSKFTIRHLFMDFQNANLATFDPALSTIKLSLGELQQLTAALGLYFGSMKGAAHPFILGYSVEAKKPPSGQAALFEPTSATFSTFKDPGRPGLNALNFLSMMRGDAFPEGPHAGEFNSNWVESGTYDGRMVISAARFHEDYLQGAILPKIGEAVRIGEPVIAHGGAADLKRHLGLMDEAFNEAFPQIPAGSGWAFYHYEDNLKQRDHEGNIGFGRIAGRDSNMLNIYAELRETLSCAVSLSTDEGVALRGVGRFTALETYFAYPLDIKTWLGYVGTARTFSFTIRLSVGTEGRLQLVTTFEPGTATQAQDAIPLLKVLDWFNLGPANYLKRIADSYAGMHEAMNRSLTEGLTQSMANLTRRVILPAGDVFFFKNITTDRARNVLLDVSYKADREAGGDRPPAAAV